MQLGDKTWSLKALEFVNIISYFLKINLGEKRILSSGGSELTDLNLPYKSQKLSLE